jgi:DNA-binding MarR family transcriptional regulator
MTDPASTAAVPKPGTPRYDAAQELGDEIVRFYRVMRGISIAKLEHREGVSAQGGILSNLSEPRRAKDLACTLGLGESAMSRHIGQLEANGLIQRVVDPADGRAQLISLTEAGAASVEQRKRERTERLLAEVSTWDEDRIRSAAEAISDIRAITHEIFSSDKS